MLLQPFEFNLFQVNTYVVWDPTTAAAAIVDPGMTGKRDFDRLKNFIFENRLKPERLLFTHLHVDHTLGAEMVMQQYGLKVEAHPDDAFLGKFRPQQAEMFRLDEQPGKLEVEVDLHDGQIIKLGEGTLKVISVPGHSPGGVVYYCKESAWALTGDSIFLDSIGRTDLPGGNQSTLVTALRQRILTLPPATVLYPGHGPATTVANELRENPFL